MTDRDMKLCEDYIVIHRKHIAKGESSDVVADKNMSVIFTFKSRRIRQ